ncbi:MAG: sulfatase family protein [Planctomycetota bacterium]|jgi:arylsulfatase A-like enzyme
MHRLTITLALAFLMFSAITTHAADPPPPPPNFILIVSDNLGYGDVGPFGNTVHRTPHLDRMAAEGVKLTSFYSTAPVCTPSRASFMTGCYPRRVNMHVDYNGAQVLMAVSPRGLHDDELTIAELLRQRGYDTDCVGKWHLGDQDPFLPRRHGFETFFGLPYSEDMIEGPGHDYRPPRPPLTVVENETVVEASPDRNYLTQRFTERVVQILKQKRKRDKPFFLYLPHTMPGSTTAPFASDGFRGRSANGPYGDAIEELDWSIGRILDTVKGLGLDDNTLIVWTSDNGAILRGRPPESRGSNAPLKGWAYSTDEGGMRMPFIARWPGRIPAGTESDELATAMDILPTFLRLAGGAPPTDRVIDGKDIWPLLAEPETAKSPNDVFFYYFLTQIQAVRSGKWKLYLPLKNKWIDFRGATVEAERARLELGDLGRPGSQQRPAGFFPNPRPLWYSRVKHRPQ